MDEADARAEEAAQTENDIIEKMVMLMEDHGYTELDLTRLVRSALEMQ